MNFIRGALLLQSPPFLFLLDFGVTVCYNSADGKDGLEDYGSS